MSALFQIFHFKRSGPQEIDVQEYAGSGRIAFYYQGGIAFPGQTFYAEAGVRGELNVAHPVFALFMTYS